jgi:hypothetical protein
MGIPVPDPQYLALHAACAKVLPMTAMVEVVNKFLEDRAETHALSEDGSSGDLLSLALTMA